LYDFFRKRGFSVTLVEEFTTSKYYKEILRKEFDKMSVADWHMAIMEEDLRELKEAIEAGNDIVLVDRSINDRQVWNYRRYLSGEMAEERYFEAKEKYLKLSKEKFRDAIIEMVEDLEVIEDFDKEKDKISAKIAEMKSKLLDKIESIKTLNLDEDRRAI